MRRIEEIIKSQGAGLARVALSYEYDSALREDLLQDILIAIHRALPGLREDASLPAFVFRIAHNRGVTHALRRRAARLAASVHEEPEPVGTPEGLLIESDRALRLQAAVRRLPLPYRQVVTLVLEDLSHAEIAEALGLTLSNVAVRVNRAKAMLREIIDHDP